MAILSYVHEIQTVYNVVQTPQMILLSEKGAHGVSLRCEKVGMLLPQRSYGSTFMTTTLFMKKKNNFTMLSVIEPVCNCCQHYVFLLGVASSLFGMPDATLSGLTGARGSRATMVLRAQNLFTASCLLLALGVASQPSQDPQLLLQGRFGGDIDEDTGIGSLPVLFSWPASSVFLTFNSTSINATLAALPPLNATYGRYAFYLDQTQASVETMTPNNTSIRWGRSGLISGSHNLTITKLSEASFGQASLETLSLGTDGR